ncbi:acyltransferase [Nocardioides koreensis]|uniref:Acyltransferase n=1 Tax=Nocardioides koreensis TaxID=433651 RepID=A0ABP5KY75_9ACTN
MGSETKYLSGMKRSNNSIGFLRLAAATLVIVGHSFPLGGYGDDPLLELTNNQIAIGRFPVDVFFALSGYLIAMSYTRSSHWGVFAWHRFLRIYPAFWVCIVLTGITFASLLGTGPNLHYLLRNAPIIFGINDTVPGLFIDTPAAPSVNSSLWTLPWELRAYALVLILGLTGLLTRIRVVLPLFLVSWLLLNVEIFSYPGAENTSPAVTSGARLMSFFLAGTLFYLWRDHIRIRTNYFAGALITLIVATLAGTQWADYSAGLFYAVAPLPLTYCVFWLAATLPLQRVNTSYDFSYGIYIYGTLTLNLLADQRVNEHVSWLAFLLLAIVFGYAAAVASWYLIEKPAQAFKDWRPRRRRPQTKRPDPVGSGGSADL